MQKRYLIILFIILLAFFIKSFDEGMTASVVQELNTRFSQSNKEITYEQPSSNLRDIKEKSSNNEINNLINYLKFNSKPLSKKGMPKELKKISLDEKQKEIRASIDHPKTENRYIILLDRNGLATLEKSERTKEINKITSSHNKIKQISESSFRGSVKNVINAVFLEDVTQEKLTDIMSYARSIYPTAEIHKDNKKYPTLYDSVPLIGADKVWAAGYDGSGTDIAILDSGINYSHVDFGSCQTFQNCPKILGGYDFANNDNDPYDDYGHGTHVAAIAASEGNLKGVAPGAKLYIYKILSSEGYGYDSWIIAAIEEAVDPNNDGDFSDHVDVISMSIGGSGTPDDPLSQSVDNANDIGSLVAVAASNFWSGAEYGDIDCPGCARKAFTVGATDKQDEIAYFSGKGPVLYNGENIIKPDISAPGVYICAADAYPTWPADCFDNEHLTLRGTSMATPHIAGVAALLKQAYSSYEAEEIKSILSQTTKDLPYDIYTQGSGRVNASNTVLSNLEAYIKPHILNLGIMSPTDTQKTFNFDIINTRYQNHEVGIITKEIIVKNIQTGNDNTFVSTQNQLCLDQNTQSKTITFDINFSNLPTGYYSGYMEVDIYDDCNLTQYIRTIRIPVGFVKLYEVFINFIGTPNTPSNYYIYLDYKISTINSNGEVNKYNFYEYTPNNNYNYQYNYSIYTLDDKLDLVALMVENGYYPDYDNLNINYFIDHIDTKVNNNMVFDESNAQHIQQNLIQAANSKNLQTLGFKTELLQKNDYYSDILYYFHPSTGPFNNIEFGMGANNVNNLFNQDYMVYFSPHARDVNSTYETTQNYMILPFTINHPFTNLNKIINTGDLKNIPLTIPYTLTPYFNQNFYFGVNSYTPLNYWSDANPEKIMLPRDGTFYYLDNCEECYYHYKSYVDPTYEYNYFIFSNYFDGKAKYVLETTNRKPSFVSFFEEPLKLNLDNEHCVQYAPGVYRFCDSPTQLHDVLKGFLDDKFNQKAHLMTENTSGNLIIETPAGNNYSIFSNDNYVLPFGRFGSWIINCDKLWYSFPDTLNNPEFCQDGIYNIYWEMPNVVKGETLKLLAKANHQKNKFQIIELCYPTKNPSSWRCESPTNII